MVMDPYDVALTKLKRDSDKDFQDMLQLAEKIPFDLDFDPGLSAALKAVEVIVNAASATSRGGQTSTDHSCP